MEKISKIVFINCFILLISTTVYSNVSTDFIAKKIYAKYGETGTFIDEIFQEKGRYLFEKHEDIYYKLCKLIDKDNELGKIVLLYYQDVICDNVHDKAFINAFVERVTRLSIKDRQIVIKNPSLFYITIYDKKNIKNTYKLIEKKPYLAAEILFYLSLTSSEEEIENVSKSIMKYSNIYKKYGVWAADYFSISSESKVEAAAICYLIYKSFKNKDLAMEIISRNYDDIMNMIKSNQFIDAGEIKKVCFFINTLSEDKLTKIYTSNKIFRFFNESDLKYNNVYEIFEKVPDLYFIDILYDSYNENPIMKESFLIVISESEYYSYYLNFFYENSGNYNLKQILGKREYIKKYDNKIVINEYIKKIISIYNDKNGGRNKLMNRIVYFENLRGKSFYTEIFDISPSWIEYASGYDALKLLDKSLHGEEVSASELLFGALDAVDVVVTIGTLGMGSVATKAIKSGSKKIVKEGSEIATKKAGKKIIEEMGEEGLEKIFKNSKKLANISKKGKGVIKTAKLNNNLFKGLDITKQIRTLDNMLKNTPFKSIRKSLFKGSIDPRIIHRGDRKVILNFFNKTVRNEVLKEGAFISVGVGSNKFLNTKSGMKFLEEVNRTFIKGRELYEERRKEIINF
ncbi:MAG: hypothetical protein B6I28_04525 [Fusobacteriia bacterium 4572_132]|nr:MAG: hypothetical protein B6I28_04525 [Fusobacteriia bacterium 4572_132]